MGIVLLNGIPLICEDIQHTEGSILVVHKTDDGFSVTQHTGEEAERVTLRVVLMGTQAEQMITKTLIRTMKRLKRPVFFFSPTVFIREAGFESIIWLKTSREINLIRAQITLKQVRAPKWWEFLLGSAMNISVSAVNDFAGAQTTNTRILTSAGAPRNSEISSDSSLLSAVEAAI